MQKKLCFGLLVVALSSVKPAPTDLGTLDFDKLDTDLADLKYEVEEEDLDDFSKLLDEADDTSKNGKNGNVNTSGYKKKNTSNKGTKNKHSIEDLKKFYKIGGVKDTGAYDDDEIYAVAQGVAGTAVGIKGNEDRKYRKGTKTRGFHRVHHKDEYKKDKLFYEDDEVKGNINKAGAKGFGVKLSAGAGFDKGHFNHNHQKGIFAKRGYQDKGFANKELNEYSDDQGFDGSFSNES